MNVQQLRDLLDGLDDCPGCQGTSFTASPRSETYWAS